MSTSVTPFNASYAPSVAHLADGQERLPQCTLKLERPFPCFRLHFILDIEPDLARKAQGHSLGQVQRPQNLQENGRLAVARRRVPEIEPRDVGFEQSSVKHKARRLTLAL